MAKAALLNHWNKALKTIMWELTRKKKVKKHIFLTVAASRHLTLKVIIEKYTFLKDLKKIMNGTEENFIWR